MRRVTPQPTAQPPANPLPTAADLARQVLETLDLQQSFFRTPPGALARGELFVKCKRAEIKLRQLAERVLEPPTLF